MCLPAFSGARPVVHLGKGQDWMGIHGVHVPPVSGLPTPPPQRYHPICTHVRIVRTYNPTVPSFLPSFLPTYLPSFLPSFLPSYLHRYLPTYLPTYLHAYIPTCLPATPPHPPPRWYGSPGPPRPPARDPEPPMLVPTVNLQPTINQP